MRYTAASRGYRMFNSRARVTNDFLDHCQAQYRSSFPERTRDQADALEQACRTAVDLLIGCDCPYHDLEHSLLVTDAGMTMLRGRQLTDPGLDADAWLHAVVAMLFHDIGYLRGLLAEDRPGSYLIDAEGRRAAPPAGSTDAWLMPYHVTRGCLFVRERFADHGVLDAERLVAHIEMTRFPVPAQDSYQTVDSLSALVRAADLIGQMADPAYIRKLSRLFTEFVETGEAQRLGYDNAAELRRHFPDFFYDRVYPFVTTGLRWLQRTEAGQPWLANLQRHLHEAPRGDLDWGPGRGPEPDWQQPLPAGDGQPTRPKIAVSNP